MARKRLKKQLSGGNNAEKGNNLHSKSANKWAILLLSIWIIFLAGFFIYKQLIFSGMMSLDIPNTYLQGENLSGNIILTLDSGHLIPIDSKIIITQKNFTKEILFSALFASNANGTYYIEGLNLSGSGNGYGFPGRKTAYPNVSFKLEIYALAAEENLTEENQTIIENLTAENLTEENQTIIENLTEENQTEITGFLITGQAILENKETIEGICSKGNDFIYNLEPNETAEINESSVKINNTSANKSFLNLEISGIQARISTAYEENYSGFGPGYTGENYVIQTSISTLKIPAINGTLNITLVYNNIILAETSKQILVESRVNATRNLTSNRTVQRIANATLNRSVQNSANNTSIAIPSNETVTTKQFKAVIGMPVKWVKIVDIETGNLEVEIPKEAENITIRTDEKINETLDSLTEYENKIKQADRKDLITGTVLMENLKITGRAIGADLTPIITETAKNKIINLANVAGNASISGLAIEYYTPAPQISEEDIAGGKRVGISASTELGYTDILAYAELNDKIKLGEKDKIRLIWVNKNQEEVQFDAYDLDSDGKIDYIEWNVPYLSEQVYEITYVAKSLSDSNRSFIFNIYEQAKEKITESTQSLVMTILVMILAALIALIFIIRKSREKIISEKVMQEEEH